MELGIRDLKAKLGQGTGLKVRLGGGMPNVTLGITGFHEILRRDYGIGEPYWGPTLVSCRRRTDSCRPWDLHLTFTWKNRKFRLENQMVGAMQFVDSFAAVFRLVTQSSSPK